jgi:hypothetical protein
VRSPRATGTKVGSMPWKTGFHCVEKWPKPASIVWKIFRNTFPLCGKTPETWFHCVELFAAQGKPTTSRAGGRGSARAAGGKREERAKGAEGGRIKMAGGKFGLAELSGGGGERNERTLLAVNNWSSTTLVFVANAAGAAPAAPAEGAQERKREERWTIISLHGTPFALRAWENGGVKTALFCPKWPC